MYNQNINKMAKKETKKVVAPKKAVAPKKVAKKKPVAKKPAVKKEAKKSAPKETVYAGVQSKVSKLVVSVSKTRNSLIENGSKGRVRKINTALDYLRLAEKALY